MRRLVWLAFIALAAAACSPAAAVPGERTVQVRIHHSRFIPAEIDAAPGETIRFVLRNTDPIDHEFILGDERVQLAHERGTEAFHPPRPGEVTIPAGETVTTTFTFRSDDLPFACHLPGHWAYGMAGVVRVG
jgi:uncharacterized cupredoxin-like copper-binding protein